MAIFVSIKYTDFVLWFASVSLNHVIIHHDLILLIIFTLIVFHLCHSPIFIDPNFDTIFKFIWLFSTTWWASFFTSSMKLLWLNIDQSV